EAAPSVLRLRTVVTDIRWRPGHVEVVTRSSPDGNDREQAPDQTALAQELFTEQVFTAPRVIVTLPLGVLQAPPGAPGAVRFTPPLPEKAAALRGLVMGPVVKIVLRFREPFWERAFPERPFPERPFPERADPPPGPGRQDPSAREGSGVVTDDRSRLGFLSARGQAFPSWWAPRAAGPAGASPATGAPSAAAVAHLLTGWAGGPVAERLAALPPEGVLDRALDTLGRISGIGSGGVTARLEGAYFHDWQGDPFSRGAYSYVAVDGLAAQRGLACPVVATLFFAGEATDDQGHFATVHGAIASGRRAAREVIES
ncbi:MAG: FAD-dependent oxidoreductase, partial [Chloroflexota bacterium]|nr:FAD-dependent oxidoreductase [Chloroflexota bacterium]